MEQSKFKYLLSPENTYIIDFGNFIYEVKGAEIMNKIRDFIVPSTADGTDKSTEVRLMYEQDSPDAGL